MVETIGNFKPSLIKKDGFSFQCVCVTSLKDVDWKKRNLERKKETLNSKKRGKIKLTPSDWNCQKIEKGKKKESFQNNGSLNTQWL